MKLTASTVVNIYTKHRKIIGWVLLAISVGIASITLFKGIFSDEADNLVTGSLLLKGYSLYRDVFSHHFPFPYYWVAVIVAMFGKSIFIIRFSVLAFQTVVFALGMVVSGDYLLIGIAAIIWSILRSFYRGNMVLYSSFAGAAILLVCIIIIVILQERIKPDWKHWLLIGLFSLIAILTDPLTVYAVGIALVFLFTKKPRWGIYVGLIIGTGLLAYVGYLYFTDSLQPFWSDAVLFNSQIYGKYVYANPIRFGDLLSYAIKGLGIFDKAWLNINPLKHITTDYTDFDRWFFTGFLFRFSAIATSILLALNKRYRAAAFMYLFTASTLIIERWDFRAQPFIMVSIIAISALITNEWWWDTRDKKLKTAQIVVGIMVLILTMWLGARLTVNIYKLRNTYGEKQLIGYKNEALDIQKLTCNQSNVLLGYYPEGSYKYWYTGLNPVSKYAYMYPWVAEFGLKDVIDELSKDQVLAVVVRQDSILWDIFDSKEYLHALDEFLEANYHKVKEGVYISPELNARCP